MLREHNDAVEADFDHFYRYRSTDVALADLGLQRFWLRVKFLPADAALWRDIEQRKNNRKRNLLNSLRDALGG